MFPKTINLLLILLLSFGFSACVKNNQEEYFNEYFPLEVGNTWVYDYTYSIPSRPNDLSDSALISQEIIKDTLLADGTIAYVMRSTRNTGSNVYAQDFLWYLKDDAFHSENYTSQYRYPSVLYKTELKKGLSWAQHPQSPNNSIYATKTVEKEYAGYQFLNQVAPAFLISKGDSVSTPYLQNRVEEVYVPYVGLVRRKTEERVYGVIHLQTLILTDYYSK